MSLENVRHLTYVRERAHGHVFIVRCVNAPGTALAGRLCYVPESAGEFVIDGRRYRKVGMMERSANTYPLLSQFARDAVHLVPMDAIDRLWDPFDDCPTAALGQDPQLRFFVQQLMDSLGESSDQQLGLIGSRLVASGGVNAQSDVDLAVRGDQAWQHAAQQMKEWVQTGEARLLPDATYPEFEVRRTELSLDSGSLQRIRQRQWWRKIMIGDRLVSLSCVSGIEAMPDGIDDSPAEVEVSPDGCYSAGTAPYRVTSSSPSEFSGALHLSWFLRLGFRGKVRGKLAHWKGRQWVWVSSPRDLQLVP